MQHPKSEEGERRYFSERLPEVFELKVADDATSANIDEAVETLHSYRRRTRDLAAQEVNKI